MTSKCDKSFEVIYDAINNFEDWDLYNDIDPDSPEQGWEDFVLCLATEIHASLVQEKLDKVGPKERLQSQLYNLKEERKRVDQKLRETVEELNKYS